MRWAFDAIAIVEVSTNRWINSEGMRGRRIRRVKEDLGGALKIEFLNELVAIEVGCRMKGNSRLHAPLQLRLKCSHTSNRVRIATRPNFSVYRRTCERARFNPNLIHLIDSI